MNDVITALNGTITPEPVNSELYRDFLNRKADDVITALNGTITPAPIGDELYRDFIDRKFDDVIAGIGSYIPPVSFPTVSGSICTFNSQYAGLPLKSHTIALTATQSGSGTPSPSNPRPISGYSAINIQRIANNEVVGTIPSANIDATGKIIADVRFTLIIAPITNGIDYVMNNGETQFVYAFYNDMPVGGSQSYDTSRIVNTNKQFTAPINGYVALRINSGVSDYSVCKGNAYSITIGSTVYGGEYDARTGVFVATHERYNLGSFTWGYNSGQTRFYTTSATDIEVPTQYADLADITCEIYETVSFTQLTSGSVNNQIAGLRSGTNNFISCRDTRYTDPAIYKTAMNGVYAVCRLAQPQVIQLPPCPIDTLEVNNIWADTGDTTLQYPKFG